MNVQSLRARPLGAWLAAVAATVFVVRVVAPSWTQGFVPFFPDSSSFTTVADRGPFWPRFWFDERPVGLPLVFWVLGRSERALALVQTSVYAAGAMVLWATLHRVVRSRFVAWTACIVVAAIMVQPRFAQWAPILLSESLALTTGVVLLAAWVAFAARPDRRRLWLAMVVSVAWMLVRDAHVLPFALVALPALALARWRWQSADPALRRACGHALVVGLVVCAYVTVSQDVSDRNRYPVMNNVGQRVLPDASMTSWFVDRGMPLDDALRGRTGKSAFDDGFATLNDPALVEFRDWADGPGQRTQLLSFAVRPGFWLDALGDALPRVLGEGLDDYDLYGVSERLPGHVPVIGGPRSTGQLAIWTVLALAGLAIVALVRRRRLLALVVALALASASLELYLSFAGDSLEVHRHLIGPLLRLSLTLVVAIALGADALVRRAEQAAPRTTRRGDLGGMACASAGTAVVLAAFFGNELRSQDYDPLFARTVVERAGRLGGTYYQNGIHNKGPFEMVVYDAVRSVTSWGSFWFGVSAVVLVIALALGGAAAVVARRLGAPRHVSLAVAGAVCVHFALSTSDYAGVLYSRNITSALLASVVVLAVVDSAWETPGGRDRAFALSGVLLGLAVQTLLTTVFAASVVGAFVVARRATHLQRSVLVVGGTALATIAVAPFWYALRGSSDEFWAGWWTYAQMMSSGTGRTFADQWGLGWSQLLAYLRERPEIVLLVGAFVVVAHRRWRTLAHHERQVHVLLVAWVVAAEIELVLSQRYSSHYYSVLAVPLALMVAVLAAHASRGVVPPAARRRWPTSSWTPVAAVVLVLVGQGATPFWDGLVTAGGFRGFGEYTAARERSRGGTDRSTRAVLDLVSDDGDPLLAWTMYPWTYLDTHRVPATRLSWKSFMLGEIYLGRSGPQYVLPQTWDWFAADMADTDPAAYVTLTDIPVDGSTPFAIYASAAFEEVYRGPVQQVSVRRDLLDGLVGPVRGDTWVSLLAPPVGWDVTAGAVSFDGSPAGGSLVLDEDGCVRVGGVMTALDGGPLVVRFVDLDQSDEDVELGYDGTRAWSASDDVEFEAVDLGPPLAAQVPVSVVVGRRSAALVIDGVIGAAVRLDGPVQVQVEPTATNLRLEALTVGPPPPLGGC